MNWEANLAAIIKHTDASLQQQFRQFDELSGDFGPSSDVFSARPPPAADAGSTSFASAFLRDTMATMRGDAPLPRAPTSFAQHFRERQDRKRHEHQYENNRGATDDGGSDGDESAFEQPQQQPLRAHRRPRHSSGSNNVGLGFQMYSSPTYDMAQMMEQVRLSLKLEVDARAAVAERQLSALLQLCKASSEELDRLRIELCAADRQLHTLDQVQSKMRQELTTQKDIAFHLQSMCGKDESWRMQAENQLLEMRQMVATIREQGNSIQAQVQEKLSRQELLVQFNAAIEPIKAQFQATLHHQSNQLAEITRGTSSSSLLVDALTQKVNRLQSEELTMLRSEVQALKSHVARMGALGGRGGFEDEDDEEGDEHQRRRLTRRPAKRQKEREQMMQELEQQETDQRRLREEALKKEIADVLVPQAVARLVNCEMEKIVKPQLSDLGESLAREVNLAKQELQTLSRQSQDNATACQRQASFSTNLWDSQTKQNELQMRSELAAHLRELREKQDLRESALTTQFNTLLDNRLAAMHSRNNEITKSAEEGRKEAKLAIDSLQEELRSTRHALEERLHTLTCDHRSKTTTLTDEWTQKLRDVEGKWTHTFDAAARQSTQNSETVCSALRADLGPRVDRVEATAKNALETLDKLERKVATLQETPVAKAKSEQSIADEEEPKPTRRTSSATLPSQANDATQAQLTSIDVLLQKMMLQTQLQLQQQQQFVMAQAANMVSPMYSPPNWPPVVHTNGPMLSSPAVVPTTPSVAHTNGPVQASPAVVPTPVAPVSPISPVYKRNDKITGGQPASRNLGESCTRSMVAEPVDTPPTNELKPSCVVGMEHGDQKLKSDPVIDEIISRAVAEELTYSVKPSQPAASTPTTKSCQSGEQQKTGADSSTAPLIISSPTVLAPQNPPRESADPIAKVQQTLASTAKGATTEAEMAKQRIEARRKQEQELRLQTQEVSPAPLLPRASSASSLLAPETVNATEVRHSPTLVRSSSFASSPSPPQTATLVSASPPAVQTTTTSSKMAPSQPSAPSTTPPVAPTAVTSSSVAPQNASNTKSPPVPNKDNAKVTQSPTSAPPPSGPLVESKPPTPKSVPPTPGQQITHVLCDQCRLPVRSDLLVEHMQRQCIKRTISCAKCQVKCPWHEVESHQRGCQGGPNASSQVATHQALRVPSVSVTDSVPLPSEAPPLLNASTSQADQNHVSESAPTQLKKCRHCCADVATTELFDHELKCDQMLKQCPHCLRRQKVAELQEHIENCDCRLVSCPNDCGGKFLQRGIDKHLATRCPKRSATAPSSSSPKVIAAAVSGPVISPPPPPVVSVSKAVSTGKTVDQIEKLGAGSERDAIVVAPILPMELQVECKFCDEEFSTREIENHENMCDWKPKRCQHCNMVIITRDLLRHESSCKTTTKNCPHCSELMAPASLPAHTNRCSKRPIKCIRCCQLFPADSIVAHSSSCRSIPPSLSSVSGSSPMHAATGAPVKIPPPPPYPPTSSGGSERPSTSTNVQASVVASPTASPALAEENASDRLARRNLALSQLTNQTISAVSPANCVLGSNRSMPETQAKPEVDEDDHEIDEAEEEDEDEEDSDDDQLTLAQVVAEWSVENVCLWLHEDVGVPDVVPRFQQRRCNGEMLLELTESDLINDYGIKNRIHRERILSAIDAIKTSDDFSDDEEEDDAEEDEEEEEEEEEEVEGEEGGDNICDATSSSRMIQTSGQRASMSRLPLGEAPNTHNLLRRNSLLSPQQSPVRLVGAPLLSSSTLPSSSAMLRRINSALNVEFPSTNSRANK